MGLLVWFMEASGFIPLLNPLFYLEYKRVLVT